jgi:hypothetical protein
LKPLTNAFFAKPGGMQVFRLAFPRMDGMFGHRIG